MEHSQPKCCLGGGNVVVDGFSKLAGVGTPDDQLFNRVIRWLSPLVEYLEHQVTAVVNQLGSILVP